LNRSVPHPTVSFILLDLWSKIGPKRRWHPALLSPRLIEFELAARTHLRAGRRRKRCPRMTTRTLNHVETCAKSVVVERRKGLRSISRPRWREAWSKSNAQMFLLVDDDSGSWRELIDRQIEIPIDCAPLAIGAREL
jgi:hypothetical protein